MDPRWEVKEPMPHTLHYARKLVRQLPSDPSTVLLERRSYLDETFIRLYLQTCDEHIFRDPWKGLRWAKPAPGLALDYEAYFTPETSEVVKRSLVVRSYAALGSAHRATNGLEDADAAYRMALEIVDSEDLPGVEKANVDHRLAVLRMCQERGEEALALIDGATTVYRRIGHSNLGDALAIRGYILNEAREFTKAIECLREALEISEPKKRTKAARRVHYAATHELAYAVAHTSNIDDLGDAIKAANHAKSRIRHHRESPHKAALDWIVGRAALRLGSTRLAERRYKSARHEFIRLRLPYELALLDLDISVLYCQEGRWEELEKVAAETYQYFRTYSGSTSGLAALTLWLNAVRAQNLTENVVDEVRAELQSQGRCRGKR